jgi:hypothetical protein
MHVRGDDNVLKKTLVQAAAFNFGLLLRKLTGWGKPRQPQGRLNAAPGPVFVIFAVYKLYLALAGSLRRFGSRLFPEISLTSGWRVVPQ